MAINQVGEYAEACGNRGFLAGFYDGYIQNCGDTFHLGETERAIVEASLQSIDQGESMVILNPFPSTSVPLAICTSYVYSQHPRIQNTDENPMLAFPSRGYVTGFDDFHFRDATSDPSTSEVIPREVVGSLSEVRERWKLYTAHPSKFTFDFDIGYPTPGAAFVDFQKSEWSDIQFPFIEEFCEENPDMPVIYYADEDCPAVELTCERLGVEPLKVTNSLLSTATQQQEAAQTESALTTQERVIANGDVEYEYYSAVDDDLMEPLGRLIELKENLRERDLSFIEAATVFNCLTKQPFKPKYWAQRAATDGFWEEIHETLDRLRRRGDSIGGAGGTYLCEFAETANEVQGHLNENHVLQNVAMEAVQQARRADPDKKPVFVLRNEAEVDAMELAVADLYDEAALGEVDFTTRKGVEPSTDRARVVLFPPQRDSYLYEFPPSKNVIFVYSGMWDRYVQRNVKEAMDGIDTAHSANAVGGDSGPGAIDGHEFDIDALESDIQSYISRAGLRNPPGGESSDESGGRERDVDDVVVTLETGEEKRMSGGSHVTTYNEETGDATRKAARNIAGGETLLIIDEAANDIYDVLLETANKRDAVRNDEDLINRWRATLNGGMDDQNMDADDLLVELRSLGSDIEYRGTVRDWRSGDTIAPKNKADARRVLRLFRPDLNGQLLDKTTEQVWRAVKHIRTLHRRIGRNVRRVVETEADAASSVSFKGDINESMIRNIANDTERVRVVEVRQEDADE